MAEKSISIDILGDYDVVVNDFYSWEILDPYNESDSDNFSLTDEEEGDDHPVDDVKPEIKDPSPEEFLFGSPSSDVSMVSQSPSDRHLVVDDVMPDLLVPTYPSSVVSMVSQLPPKIVVDDVKPKLDKKKSQIGDDLAIGGAVTYDDSDEKYDENEDDEVENDDLYDGELVPFGLSDKFVKERITKTGRRAYGRKKTSKKLPHYYTRPGCVHGKHSLGVQHFIM